MEKKCFSTPATNFSVLKLAKLIAVFFDSLSIQFSDVNSGSV